MKKLLTTQLMPGMVTAENLFSFGGQLLVTKGGILTDSIISMLITHGIYNVKVEDALAHLPSTDFSLSYYTKLKNSPIFQEFKEVYDSTIDSFEKGFQSVLDKDVPFDLRPMYQGTLRVLEAATTGTSVIDMLQNVREYDDSTYVHCLNVALISNVLAKWLKMSEDEIEIATICGMLHDIGKLCVPKEIIGKPTKLSSDEFSIIKKHPSTGYQLLKDKDMELQICNSALMHHERCDGSGYPLGLSGNDIDKFAKLVSIADVYDAMTASRVYRGPMCPFKVIEIFEDEGLQKYEPQYIMTFLENLVHGYVSNACRLSNGQEGTIIYINKDKLSRPMVKCEDGYVNLVEKPSLYIASLI